MLIPPRKRPYSQAFRPHHRGYGRYLLDRIPAPLWKAAKAKAKRDHVSIRALLLTLLTDYTKEDGHGA